MWLDELVEMKRVSGKTLKQISAEASIPLGTLNKIFAGQTADPKFETLKAIVHCLGYSLDDLSPTNKKSPALSSEAQRVAEDYAALDDHGQRVVRVVTDEELSRLAAASAPAPDIAPAEKTVPLFGTSFAAGPAEQESDLKWEPYAVPADSRAEFAIRVHGTSMEPYLHDGQIALGSKRAPNAGDVGAFILNGEYLVKQVVGDHLGNLYLLSLNRAESDKDITIWASGNETLLTIGTILMERRPPLPRI